MEVYVVVGLIILKKVVKIEDVIRLVYNVIVELFFENFLVLNFMLKFINVFIVFLIMFFSICLML